MKNVLVIGCGGIGSFFIRELSQLCLNNVVGTENLRVTICDDDEVEEKNLRYQNFEIEELGENKACALAKRYLFETKTNRIVKEEDLKDFDIIILAVDNGLARELIYNYCDKNETYFIDLRSEGRACCFWTKHKDNTLEKLLSTIDVSKPSTSCQLKFELENGTIQIGNRIIANIGVQLLLNYLRQQDNPSEYIQRF